MADIIAFPGITRADISPATVLTAASEQDFKTVVVIGVTQTGVEYYAASCADAAEANWLADRFKQALLTFDKD